MDSGTPETMQQKVERLYASSAKRLMALIYISNYSEKCLELQIAYLDRGNIGGAMECNLRLLAEIKKAKASCEVSVNDIIG